LVYCKNSIIAHTPDAKRQIRLYEFAALRFPYFILEQHDRKISSGASAQDKNGTIPNFNREFSSQSFQHISFSGFTSGILCRNPNFCFPTNDPCIHCLFIGVCEQHSNAIQNNYPSFFDSSLIPWL
jgi:hypothetical protein